MNTLKFEVSDEDADSLNDMINYFIDRGFVDSAVTNDYPKHLIYMVFIDFDVMDKLS